MKKNLKHLSLVTLLSCSFCLVQAESKAEDFVCKSEITEQDPNQKAALENNREAISYLLSDISNALKEEKEELNPIKDSFAALWETIDAINNVEKPEEADLIKIENKIKLINQAVNNLKESGNLDAQNTNLVENIESFLTLFQEHLNGLGGEFLTRGMVIDGVVVEDFVEKGGSAGIRILMAGVTALTFAGGSIFIYLKNKKGVTEEQEDKKVMISDQSVDVDEPQESEVFADEDQEESSDVSREREELVDAAKELADSVVVETQQKQDDGSELIAVVNDAEKLRQEILARQEQRRIAAAQEAEERSKRAEIIREKKREELKERAEKNEQRRQAARQRAAERKAAQELQVASDNLVQPVEEDISFFGDGADLEEQLFGDDYSSDEASFYSVEDVDDEPVIQRNNVQVDRSEKFPINQREEARDAKKKAKHKISRAIRAETRHRRSNTI